MINKVKFSFFRTVYLYFLFWIVRILIALRYRIRIVGREELFKKNPPHKSGILFLPNHPAEMDPIILMMALWRQFHLKPTALETYYYQKGMRFFMDLVDTIPLPNMDIPNQWKIRKIEKTKKKIVEGLKAGENFLIYPSGKLKRTPEERIGGASLVHDILQEIPDSNIALIRITGFWGSMFSCALTGTSPDFGKVLWKAAKILLKNGIFFAPRREILIEMSAAPDNFPYRGSRIEVNQYLEHWYNERGPEPLKLVSYAFWKEELPEIPAQKMEESAATVSAPPEIEKTVIGHLSRLTHQPEDKIQKNLHLSNDLGVDSLDLSQLYVFLEEKYNVTGLVPGEVQTVADLINAAAGHKKEIDRPKENGKKKPAKWPSDQGRPAPEYPTGTTLQEVFLKSCDRMGHFTACADQTSGVVSYRKLKKTILVLALKIRQLPGENIGILLPSSVGAYALIFATLLAKKTPVMLNWTAGSKALEHAATITELKVVLSSFRFLNRLENADLGNVDDLLVLLENMRREIPLYLKLKGLFLHFFSAQLLLKFLKLDTVKVGDRAVIIFTSGTETLPKGVPLTHDNLLNNQRAGMTHVKLKAEDLIYSVLPPFHSFGFSITGTFPLVTGLKTFFAPDPTNTRGMANDMAQWKPTIFCCPPSFIKALFHVAGKNELESLKLVVSGAEKAPQELFDFMKALGPDKQMMEGYGISECSPIVTLDRYDKEHRGVGLPIPGVELCFLDLEKEALLPQGKEGEVCVHGPGVFSGYLGYPKNPFITLQGKNWYRTGDRGYQDPDGYLFITGRLKRFIKIGGEMVSLGGLEEELIKLCEEKKWAPAQKEGIQLAVVSVGMESDKPLIVLFTTFDVNKDDLNTALREKGIGRLVKISEVRRLSEIPLTGTGKTHYRLLEEKSHDKA